MFDSFRILKHDWNNDEFRQSHQGARMKRKRPIRVCMIVPSLDILGGQSVQAQRLLKRLARSPELEVSFLPINPRLTEPMHLLQRVKYVRTIVTSFAYGLSLLCRVPRMDIVHAFSASYWSFLLAPVPAMLVGRLFRKEVILNYRSGEADDHLTRWRTAVSPMRLASPWCRRTTWWTFSRDTVSKPRPCRTSSRSSSYRLINAVRGRYS